MAPVPCKVSNPDVVEVPMAKLLLALFQKNAALFWETKPFAPMYGTEPCVSPLIYREVVVALVTVKPVKVGLEVVVRF